MNTAPVILIAYNRPVHTRRTIEALLKNVLAKNTDLIAYLDGAANDQVREKREEVKSYLSDVRGFNSVTIIDRSENYGLSRSIIAAVTQSLEHHPAIIVMEDDLVCSPYFLDFMNNGLRIYEHEPKVISLNGYCYPINFSGDSFFIRGADCLGWATWRSRWALFETDGSILLRQLRERKLTYDFDFYGSYPFTKMLEDQVKGKVGSWAIRWHASAFLSDKLTLSAGKSMIKHIGNDGSGTNVALTDFYDTEVANKALAFPEKIEEAAGVRDLIARYYSEYLSKWQRIRYYFNRVIHRCGVN